MPQPPQWEYYLLNDDGLSYNYDTSIETNDPAEKIENAPDGWQDKLVNFGRNVKWWGVFRTFTIPLRFVTEGKKVLRHIFYNLGIETVCSLLIKKLNNAWVYENYYTGEIDFSGFTDENDYCTANVMEGGLPKLLIANEATAYEIPISGSSAVPVKMDGIYFKSTITFALSEGDLPHLAFTVGVSYAFQEGTSKGILTGNSPLQDVDDFDYSTNGDRWILQSNEASVAFNWKQTLTLSVGLDADIRVYFNKNTGTEIDILPTTSLTAGVHTFDIDVTFTLNPEEKLFIIAENSLGGATFLKFFSSEANVTFFSRTLPSTIFALPVSYVFKQLISKITDSAFEGESDYLDSRTDLVLTSGDAIRRLTGSVIKTNFNDNYKFSYSVLNLALGIEDGNAKLEELEYFFDNTSEIADLGEVRNLKTSFAKDLIYNSIKVGYADQKYDDVNGRDEFNSTQIYKSPITRIAKEWDLISPYRADAIGLEFLRANLTEKKTTDSDSDNDIFIIQIEEVALLESDTPTIEFGNTVGTEGTMTLETLTIADVVPGTKLVISGTSLNNGTFTITGLTQTTSQTIIITKEATTPETVSAIVSYFGYGPKRGPYDTTPTGLISPDSIFNVELSPKRNLLRHANYYNSIYHTMTGQEITFQSALKNAELVSSVDGVEVSEKANIEISDTPKLFLPVYFKFDCQVPVDLVELMATNSRGYFSFTWLGNPYKGFPMDISIKPADNDVQEFTLLACPDVDLTTLI